MSSECLEWIIGMVITALAVVCLASDRGERRASVNVERPGEFSAVSRLAD